MAVLTHPSQPIGVSTMDSCLFFIYTADMQRDSQGFGVAELVVFLAVIGIVAIAGLYIWRQKPIRNDEKPATKTLLATVVDSGSTNLAGWELAIYSDGSAQLHCDPSPRLHNSCSSTTDKSDTNAANRLSSDLASTPLQPQYDCIRSVSFGSVQTLRYNGKSAIGIDCYLTENPSSSLSKDLLSFLLQANLH